ncbi:MAG TPA: CdaR family protein [Lactobacillaceae bacterium]
MKKWSQSRIFNLLIALLLAVVLSAYVSSTSQNTARTRSNGSFTNLVSQKTQTLTVDLNLLYDDSDYVVVGAPSTVKVTLKGPEALVTTVVNRDSVVANLDLRQLKAGQHTVNVSINGVASDLTATAQPATVTVTLSPKLTRSVPVTLNYNDKNIAAGYRVQDATTDPTEVNVTGPEANVQSVDHVEATLSIPDGTNATFSDNAALEAVDAAGNKVDVNISPKTVTGTLTIGDADSKSIPVTFTTSNGDAADYTIKADPANITIYGDASALAGVQNIAIPVDLNDITKKTTQDVTLKAPDGIERLSKKTVTVTITPKQKASSSSSSASSSSKDKDADKSSSSSSSSQ